MRRGLIITDGVFSMDGDIAPLDAICEAAEDTGMLLMVDDAHGEGVLGRAGAASSTISGCTAACMWKSAR